MIKIAGFGRLRSQWYQLLASETGLRKRIWQYWHNLNGQRTVAFLVGSGRSGTNMLVSGLAKSWQVELYNENHPVAFKSWYLRDFSMIEALVERSYAHLVLFKPLKDTYRTHVLLSNFPDAKVLFVFRHYHDVINSALQRFYDDSGLVIKPVFEDRRAPVVRWINTDFAEFSTAPPPEETEQLIRSMWTPSLNLESNIALDWLFTNRLYFDLNLFQNTRVKLVQYEAVVLDPLNEFRSLCQFLGLSFEQKMVKGIFSSSLGRNSPPAIDPEIRAVCEELWQRLCHHTGTE